MTASTVEVASAQPYEVLIGEGITDRVPGLLRPGTRQAAVIYASPARGLAEGLAGDLDSAGVRPLMIEAPDAESAKTAEFAARCWHLLGERAFTRSDAVVSIGGGATTDVGGFVAATWLRGVDHIVVPTTLLGMVDAAVGGKTGINTPEGKNLVGAFHEPRGVVCDLATLRMLPAADYTAGLAEVIKCGLIADPEILRLIEADPQSARTAGSPVEAELVRRSVRVKAGVVAGDLREATTASAGGPDLPRVTGREVLNYGHTLGHAIEQVEGYTWRHGDAVSVGMVFVAELAAATGTSRESLADGHRAVLSSVGLPVALPAGYGDAEFGALVTAMGRDKKSRGSQLRFVVLADIADPRLLSGPPESAIETAFRAVLG